MAKIEGKGLVAPKAIAVSLSRNEISVIQSAAFDRDAHRGYATSRSQWKRGSTSNPILLGMVGEYALQKYLRCNGVAASVLDCKLNDGDGGKDATIAGVSYQVKTSGKSYSTCLIRRINESSRIVPHVSDRFVFCRWHYGDSHCDLRGWCSRETVIELGKLKKGKRGQWWNNEIDHIYFDSMKNLLLLIKQELSDVQ